MHRHLVSIPRELALTGPDRADGTCLRIDPEGMEPAKVHDRCNSTSRNLNVDLLPRRPQRTTERTSAAADQIRARPVVVGGRVAGGDPEEMQDVDRMAFIVPNVVIGAGDRHRGQILEPAQVLRIGIEHLLVGEIGLQKLLLQLVEQRRLVIAQIWLEVVFGPEEHLPVRFPDAVVLSPPPLGCRLRAAYGARGGRDVPVASRPAPGS